MPYLHQQFHTIDDSLIYFSFVSPDEKLILRDFFVQYPSVNFANLPLAYQRHQPLTMKSVWQCVALSGDMTVISQCLLKSDFNSQSIDDKGRNFAHYVAMSGKQDSLRTVLDTCPELIGSLEQTSTELNVTFDMPALLARVKNAKREKIKLALGVSEKYKLKSLLAALSHEKIKSVTALTDFLKNSSDDLDGDDLQLCLSELSKTVDTNKRNLLIHFTRFMTENETTTVFDLLNVLLSRGVSVENIFQLLKQVTDDKWTLGIHVVYYQPAQSAIKYIQFLKKLHSMGLSVGSVLHHLSAPNSNGWSLADYLVDTKKCEILNEYIEFLISLYQHAENKKPVIELIANSEKAQSLFAVLLSDPKKYESALGRIRETFTPEDFTALQISHLQKILKKLSKNDIKTLQPLLDYLHSLDRKLSEAESALCLDGLCQAVDENKRNILTYIFRNKVNNSATIIVELLDALILREANKEKFLTLLKMSTVDNWNLGMITVYYQKMPSIKKYFMLIKNMIDNRFLVNDILQMFTEKTKDGFSFVDILTNAHKAEKDNVALIYEEFTKLMIYLCQKPETTKQVQSLIESPNKYGGFLTVLLKDPKKHAASLLLLIQANLLFFNSKPTKELKSAILTHICAMPVSPERTMLLEQAAGLHGPSLLHALFKFKLGMNEPDAAHGSLNVIFTTLIADMGAARKDQITLEKLELLLNSSAMKSTEQAKVLLATKARDKITFRDFLYEQAERFPSIVYLLLNRNLIPDADFSKLKGAQQRLLDLMMHKDMPVRTQKRFLSRATTEGKDAHPLFRFMSVEPKIMDTLKPLLAEVSKKSYLEKLPAKIVASDAGVFYRAAKLGMVVHESRHPAKR